MSNDEIAKQVISIIYDDLLDRRSLKYMFNGIDAETCEEIITTQYNKILQSLENPDSIKISYPIWERVADWKETNYE